MTIIPTSEDLVAFFEQRTLHYKMARRFGLKTKAEIQVVEAQCAQLHNAGTLDLLRLAESEGLPALRGTDFFMATHFFCGVLPELEATPAQVMACIEALVSRGGDDGMATEPNAAFKAWCAKKQERALEVIAAAHSGDGLASRNLTFALEAINAITEARQIALAYGDARRTSAITALGRMEHTGAESCAETFTAFSHLLNAGADDKLRASMLHATAAILARNADVIAFDTVDLICRLVEGAGEFTVHQSAQVLWLYDKALDPNMIGCLLSALAHIKSANKGTIRAVDFALVSLLKSGHAEAAVRYLTQLFSCEDNRFQLKEFENFIPELLSGPAELVSRVVVQWLLLGTPSLCEGLTNALQGRGMEGRPLELQPEHLDIPTSAQIFVCRKAVGWFFFKPVTAASVIVSVLRVCDNDTAGTVQNLLIEALATNYSCVREYLSGISADDTAKGRVDECLAEIETHLSAIEAIPRIKELGPSEYHRRIDRLRMADQMRDVHKQAESESVFLSMIKRSVILYGNRSLSFIKDTCDTLRPVEMDLKPYGISFEMPRLEIVDPVGLDYMLRVFRRERMPS